MLPLLPALLLLLKPTVGGTKYRDGGRISFKAADGKADEAKDTRGTGAGNGTGCCCQARGAAVHSGGEAADEGGDAAAEAETDAADEETALCCLLTAEEGAIETAAEDADEEGGGGGGKEEGAAMSPSRSKSWSERGRELHGEMGVAAAADGDGTAAPPLAALLAATSAFLFSLFFCLSIAFRAFSSSQSCCAWRRRFSSLSSRVGLSSLLISDAGTRSAASIGDGRLLPSSHFRRRQ